MIRDDVREILSSVTHTEPDDDLCMLSWPKPIILGDQRTEKTMDIKNERVIGRNT